MVLYDASFLFSAIQILFSPYETIQAVSAADKHYSCLWLSILLSSYCLVFGISTRTVSTSFPGKTISTVYAFPSFQKLFLYIGVTSVLPWLLCHQHQPKMF